MKIKKKIFMMSLAASMVVPSNLALVASVATPVFAEEMETEVTRVNKKFSDLFESKNNYWRLKDDIKSSSDAYKLIPETDGSTNITDDPLQDPIYINERDMDIDFEGLTLQSSAQNVIWINSGKTLNITNGTIESSYNKDGSLGNVLLVYGTGTTLNIGSDKSEDKVTIKDGTNGRNYGVAVMMGSSTPALKATVNIKNSEINTVSGLSVSGDRYTGDNDKANWPRVNLDSVTITSTSDAIYQAGASVMTVTNCTVAGITGIETRAGELTVENGSVTGGNGEIEIRGVSGATSTKNVGVALNPYYSANTTGQIKISLNDTTVTGTATLALADALYQEGTSNGVKDDTGQMPIVNVNNSTLRKNETTLGDIYCDVTYIPFTLTNTSLASLSKKEGIEDNIPVTFKVTKDGKNSPNSAPVAFEVGEKKYLFDLDKFNSSTGDLSTAMGEAITQSSNPSYTYKVEGLNQISVSPDGVKSIDITAPKVSASFIQLSWIEFVKPDNTTTSVRLIDFDKNNDKSVSVEEINNYFANDNLEVDGSIPTLSFEDNNLINVEDIGENGYVSVKLKATETTQPDPVEPSDNRVSLATATIKVEPKDAGGNIVLSKDSTGKIVLYGAKYTFEGISATPTENDYEISFDNLQVGERAKLTFKTKNDSEIFLPNTAKQSESFTLYGDLNGLGKAELIKPSLTVSELASASLVTKVTFNEAETPLTEGEDYVVTYLNLNDSLDLGEARPTKAGTYRVVVMGKGYYINNELAGDLTVTADPVVTPDPVEPGNGEGDNNNGGDNSSSGDVEEPKVETIADNDVALPEAPYLLTDDKCEPVVTVTVGGKTLVPGTDYEVSYSNSGAMGIATVTVTGKGNYEGTVNKEYHIQKEITPDDFTLVDGPYTLSDGSNRPGVASVIVDGTHLVENTDYKVNWEDCDDFGDAFIVVTGMGDYTGTARKIYVVINDEGETIDIAFGNHDTNVEETTLSIPTEYFQDEDGNTLAINDENIGMALTNQSADPTASESEYAPHYEYHVTGFQDSSYATTPEITFTVSLESVIRLVLEKVAELPQNAEVNEFAEMTEISLLNDEILLEDSEVNENEVVIYATLEQLDNIKADGFVTRDEVVAYISSQEEYSNAQVPEEFKTINFNKDFNLSALPDGISMADDGFLVINAVAETASTTSTKPSGGSGGSSSKPTTTPEEPTQPTTVGKPTTMYRLYNRLTGEHLYTTDKAERDHLLTSDTWKDEGQGWTAPDVSDYPVYRLLNPNNGDHHYTTDKNEFETLPTYGWVAEGIAFFSADKDDAENVILHRLYNPNANGAGSHHYTTDENEKDALVKLGWQDEGTAWAGLKSE